MRKVHLCLHFPFMGPENAYATCPVTDMTETERAAYVDAVIREMQMTAEDLRDAEDFEVCSVALTGGSPTLMGPARMEGLLRALRKAMPVREDAEMTLQEEPALLSSAWMIFMQNQDMNRLQIRLLSGRASDYARYGLSGSIDIAEAALILPQMFHIPHYAAELVAGFPGQSEDNLLVSSRLCVKFHTKEILFLPFQEPRSEAWRKTEGAGLERIGLDGREQLMRKACDYLTSRGYDAIGHGHYAVKGAACVNLLARETQEPDEDYLSFGVGTSSRSEGIVYRTVSTVSAYIRDAQNPQGLYRVISKI